MSNNQTTNKPPRMRGHGPMGGGPGGRGPVEKAKDVKGTTKKLGQRLSSYKIAREIKDKIEDTMQYPGTIKVVVIRETRAEEVAK